jgi:PAS domain S-box-containing protein
VPFFTRFRIGWFLRPPSALRYTAAIFLAAAAQMARLPLDPPTLMPYITYVPFMVLSAAYGGFWPGLLTTGLCFLESMYFAAGPEGGFIVRDPQHWFGLGALLFAGLVVSFLFERTKRARQSDAATRELAALLDQTYDAVFVWELESNRIAFWGRGAQRLYGYSAREALGRPPQELLSTRFPESLATCLAAIRQSGYWQGELAHTTRDGREIAVESRMSFRQGDDGHCRVIEVARDIGERQRLAQTQAQLAREGELRRQTLESIIQNSPACIALLRGPDFTYESVNPAYQALGFGEPMAGRTVAEVWPEAAPLMLPILNAVREAQTAYHAIEARIPRRRAPEGPVEERYFDFSYVPLPGPGGEIQVLVAAIEVTRHKTAEDELRAANQELTTIYANAPVALMVLDDDLRVRKLNDMAVGLAGPAASEPLGLQLGGVLGCLNALAEPRGCGYGLSCPQCPLRLAASDSLRNGTRYENVEAWVRFAIEGRTERRCLSVSTAPMEPNGVRMVLVCAHDITRRKISEDALRETVQELESALAQKTVLLKEVHHRVKNNLAVISSLLSMKADSVGTRKVRLALEESQRRVLSIALIHDQLYGSEFPDRIDFREYTRQLVRQLHFALVDEPERIAIRLDAAPIEMGVHRAVPCALILNELVSNAFKHAFPRARRGEIRISLRESAPGYLELAIEDNGVGFAPGLAEGNAKSFGLKIVEILSRQLEGSFERQTAIGGGTRFVFQFPADTARRVEPCGWPPSAARCPVLARTQSAQ